MDSFEVMVLSLRFFYLNAEDIEDKLETHISKTFLDITTFSNGQPQTKSVDLERDLIDKRKSEMVYLGGHVIGQQKEEYVYYVRQNPLEMADLTILLSTNIARFGLEGWEVVDFKVSTNRGYQAQAILKRKVQKE